MTSISNGSEKFWVESYKKHYLNFTTNLYPFLILGRPSQLFPQPFDFPLICDTHKRESKKVSDTITDDFKI